MGHNVLKGYIVVKGESGPRPPKGVEAMTHGGDVQTRQNFFECIPNANEILPQKMTVRVKSSGTMRSHIGHSQKCEKCSEKDSSK